MKLNTGTWPAFTPPGIPSPGCSSHWDQSMLRPSMRGGVPVFRRPCGSLSSFRRADRPIADGSPARPAAQWLRPTWILPSRKQPPRARAKDHAHLRDSTHPPVALEHQVIHGLLEQPQPGLVLQPAADRGLVQQAIGLRARGPHRRAFGTVENAKLYAALVRGQRHRATERIHLLDQMALANAANGGVAAHLAQSLQALGQQQRPLPQARSSQRGLGARMASADDDHIEFLRIQHESTPGPAPPSPKHPARAAAGRPPALPHPRPMQPASRAGGPQFSHFAQTHAPPCFNRAMPTALPLLIFAGSTRQQSLNRRLARASATIARDAGASVTLLELSDFDIPLYHADLPNTPADVIRLKEVLWQHPAWIICSPDYNGSYTALLKNTIDWASCPVPAHPDRQDGIKPLRGKVVGLLSASPGAMGGRRSQSHLASLLINLECWLAPKAFALGQANSAFDAQGALVQQTDRDRVRAVVDQVLWAAGRLHADRIGAAP